MIQLSIPLSRNTDPITSHRAAERVSKTIPHHEATIYAAICEAGDDGLTYKEIAEIAFMEPVQVARRLKGMEQRLLITRYLNEFKEPAEVRDGCAVWWKR